MLPKKRLAPMRRIVEKSEKKEEVMDEFTQKNSIEGNDPEFIKKPDGPRSLPLHQAEGNFEFPEFLRKADNEQYLQMFIRMRQRHNADGAVSLHVDADDIADQNLELYDNKGINIDPPLINENLAENTEYYIESVNRDQFHKIPKKVLDELEKEKERDKVKPGRKQEKNYGKLQTKPDEDEGETRRRQKKISELGRATEDEIFASFDLKLTEIINKTSNKVSLLFLFAQGLLAGVSLVNILLLFQYVDFKSFLIIYSYNVREIFNFTHFLTFGSLVGNGIKFISSYKRYKFAGSEYIQSENRSKIKKSMIFSAIIFVLFTIIFGILMYLASYVPLILYSKFIITTEIISEDSFTLFATLYIVCNFLAILNFILNIFDVRVSEDSIEMPRSYVSSQYDPEATRENSLVNF